MGDYRGYMYHYPPLRWPGDANLALSLVLNIEEGAQLSMALGDAVNEAQHEVRNQIVGVPDFCMDTHFEYGARVGYWRVMRALDAHAVPVTLNVCARALETTPWVGARAARRGDEICSHGWRWESHALMDRDRERQLVERCVASIRKHWGRAPVGWHTKSSPSIHTRRLIAEAGFLYDSDAYNDDAPYYVPVAAADGWRWHLVLPYAFDTNDMRFFEGYQFVHARDFVDYLVAGFDALWSEGAHAPRMMTVGLHTRIIGRPARIEALSRFLRHVADRGKVWVATREQIARHWLAHCPAPEARPRGPADEAGVGQSGATGTVRP